SAELLGGRYDLALLLGVEAVRVEETFEARSALLTALLTCPGLTSFLHFDEAYVQSLAFSPNGKTLASAHAVGSDKGGVVLWDPLLRKLSAPKLLPVEGDVRSVAFSPDGKILAAGCSGGAESGVVLWDAGQRSRLSRDLLLVSDGNVSSLAFSPDGQT